MKESNKIIFDHLVKTAGTAITEWLRSELGNQVVSPALIETHKNLIKNYGVKYPILSGHIKFELNDLFSNDYQYITLIREPIDRIISMLYFLCDPIRDQPKELVESAKIILESEGQELVNNCSISNLLVHHFCDIRTNKLITEMNDEDKVNSAFNAIKKYSLVGLYEEMALFLHEFSTLINIIPISEIPKKNVTFTRPKVDEISKNFRNRLVELNQLDIQLYEKIKEWKYKEWLEKSSEQIFISKIEWFLSKNINDFKYKSCLGGIKLITDIFNLSPTIDFDIIVEIFNGSEYQWLSNVNYPINLSYHWKNKDDKLLVHNGKRTTFSRNVLLPNHKIVLPMKIKSPDKAGEYILELTLVREGMYWFEDMGFKSFQLEVKVGSHL